MLFTLPGCGKELLFVSFWVSILGVVLKKMCGWEVIIQQMLAVRCSSRRGPNERGEVQNPSVKQEHHSIEAYFEKYLIVHQTYIIVRTVGVLNVPLTIDMKNQLYFRVSNYKYTCIIQKIVIKWSYRKFLAVYTIYEITLNKYLIVGILNFFYSWPTF